MAFRLLKDYLGMRVLWSAKWDVVSAQIWACVILAQILHSWQVRLAAREQVEPKEISLKLLMQQSHVWIAQGKDVQKLLHELGRELGIIRPSSRREIQVIEVSAQTVAWPPPPEVLEPRQARYGHKKTNAAPRTRKKKGDKTEQDRSPAKAKTIRVKAKTKTNQSRVYLFQGKLRLREPEMTS